MSKLLYPLSISPGLGYSPSSGPPVGGFPYNQGPGFFGQSMDSVMPIRYNEFGFGRKKSFGCNTYGGKKKRTNSFGKRTNSFGKRTNSFGKRTNSFGYPLMNQPSKTLNESRFPRYPSGPGNTPGGTSVSVFPSMPNTGQYWAYGKPRNRRSKIKKSRRKSHRKSRRKSHRKSRRKSNG